MISLRQQGIWFAPFPVSPSGGKRGAPPPPLRYGSGKAPAQSRTLISVLGPQGKGLHFYLTGLRPGRESSTVDTNRTNHLLIKADILTCYEQGDTGRSVRVLPATGSAGSDFHSSGEFGPLE